MPPAEERPAFFTQLSSFAPGAPNVTELWLGPTMSICFFALLGTVTSGDLTVIFPLLASLWPRLVGLHDVLCNTMHLNGQLFTEAIIGLSQLQRLSLMRQEPAEQACVTNTLKIRTTLCKHLYRPIRVLELADFPPRDSAFLVRLLAELPSLERCAQLHRSLSSD